MATEESKDTYFQYVRDKEIPIFVKCNLSDFDNGILNILKANRFQEVPQSDISKIEEIIAKNDAAKLLHISIATPVVSRQIEATTENDRFGLESITPRNGYRIYRYKGVGMMVYSFTASEWQLGCYSDFGDEISLISANSVISRYLSWAFASTGVVGFWGLAIDEGIVILNQSQSNGEAVFIDHINNRLFSNDGDRQIKGSLKIIRLDSAIHKKQKFASREELLSFLHMRCTYFDFNGLSVPIRQVIQRIAKTSDGIIYPEKNFRAKTDLSL